MIVTVAPILPVQPSFSSFVLRDTGQNISIFKANSLTTMLAFKRLASVTITKPSRFQQMSHNYSGSHIFAAVVGAKAFHCLTLLLSSILLAKQVVRRMNPLCGAPFKHLACLASLDLHVTGWSRPTAECMASRAVAFFGFTGGAYTLAGV